MIIKQEIDRSEETTKAISYIVHIKTINEEWREAAFDVPRVLSGHCERNASVWRVTEASLATARRTERAPPMCRQPLRWRLTQSQLIAKCWRIWHNLVAGERAGMRDISKTRR